MYHVEILRSHCAFITLVLGFFVVVATLILFLQLLPCFPCLTGLIAGSFRDLDSLIWIYSPTLCPPPSDYCRQVFLSGETSIKVKFIPLVNCFVYFILGVKPSTKPMHHHITQWTFALGYFT